MLFNQVIEVNTTAYSDMQACCRNNTTTAIG